MKYCKKIYEKAIEEYQQAGVRIFTELKKESKTIGELEDSIEGLVWALKKEDEIIGKMYEYELDRILCESMRQIKTEDLPHVSQSEVKETMRLEE